MTPKLCRLALEKFKYQTLKFSRQDSFFNYFNIFMFKMFVRKKIDFIDKKFMLNAVVFD